MKDPRPLHVKYYELKVKITDDLDNNKKSWSSLLNSAHDPKENTESQNFYQIWADLIKSNLDTLEQGLNRINTQIKNEGLDDDVNQLITKRNESIKKSEIRKKEELLKEIEGLPE